MKVWQEVVEEWRERGEWVWLVLDELVTQEGAA